MATGRENHPPDGSRVWQENLNEHLICPDCKQNPPNLIEDKAETICGDCGNVLADRLVSYESEWRTFNSDEGKGDDPNRVGEAENELLNGNQLATRIGGGGPNASLATRKLQSTQSKQTADKSNKALLTAYNQIELWGSIAAISPEAMKTAKTYFKLVDDAKAFKGKSTDAIMAGCLFIACRQNRQPRAFSEIFGLTSVPKKEIGRVYKALEKFLTQVSDDNIKRLEDNGGVVNRKQYEYQGTQSTKPADLCVRYCAQLGLLIRVEQISKRLAEQIPNIETLAGRSPLSNAAACIYFAGNLLGFKVSTKKVSEVANVSDATIKHAYKLLLAEKDTLIEKDWLGKQPLLPGGIEQGFGDVRNLPAS